MSLNMLSYGQLTLLSGGAFFLAGIVLFIAGNIIISAKRNKIKKELTDKYGF